MKEVRLAIKLEAISLKVHFSIRNLDACEGKISEDGHVNTHHLDIGDTDGDSQGIFILSYFEGWGKHLPMSLQLSLDSTELLSRDGQLHEIHQTARGQR